jgi:predicted transcriptional regulator
MRFVRLTFGKQSGTLIGVCEQDTPYELAAAGSITVSNQETETVDLGAVELEVCYRPDGTQCAIAEWIHRHHMGQHATREEVAAKVAAVGTADAPPGALRFHAVPCTMDGLKAHFRANGPDAISVKVRAWLAVTLPPRHAAAIGLGGVPIAAMKAMEGVRNRRDPASGSRLEMLERFAQQNSDRDAARRLAARKAKG